MKNPTKICAWASGILLLGFVVLYVFTWIFNLNQKNDWSYISLGKTFHIAVTKNWGGNFVFFNQDKPYTGSIIAFSGDKTIHEWGLTGSGIYFRHIENTAQNNIWWTLMISLWYPIIFFGILSSVFFVKNRRVKLKAKVHVHRAL